MDLQAAHHAGRTTRVRLRPGDDTTHGSTAAYLTVLAGSALGGVALGAGHPPAAAITLFALVLAAGTVLATVAVDVLPRARRRHRAGYRLRRGPRLPAPPVLRAGQAPDLLALATWAPARDGADARSRAAARAALRTVRAVCAHCDTITDARAGTCLTCGGAVVPRQG